jgi:hypothetical protein
VQDPGKAGEVSFPGQEASVGAPYLSAATGRVYFEVECEGFSDVECEGASGEINVGLAGTNFRGQVVSACEASWSIYNNGKAYHRSAAPGGGSATAALTLPAAGMKK